MAYDGPFPLVPKAGGTGVANTGSITLGGSLTTSGAFASTFTMTNTTSVTFPTSGTLATTSQLITNTKSTWTPALTFGGGNTGLTYSSQAGVYWQIGSVVYFTGYVTLSAKGSSTGSVAITLPSTAANDTSGAYVTNIRVNAMASYPSGTTMVLGVITPNTNSLSIDAQGVNFASVLDSNCTNTTQFVFSGFYWTT